MFALDEIKDRDYQEALRETAIMYLTKSGLDADRVYEIVQKLYDHDNVDYTEDEIRESMRNWYNEWNSEGEKPKSRFISKEVAEFVATSSGYFALADCYTTLQATSKDERDAIRTALRRLKDKGIVEKYGKKEGVYRRVETELDYITFDDTEEVPFPIILPFSLHDMVDISEGNIILVGGEYNSGKTTFCLEVLLSNKNRVPIRYLSSEVSHQSEFKKRWRKYQIHQGIPMEFWLPDKDCEYISRSADFSTALKPKAINIIDYLEFPESDFTQGAEILRQIHDKLAGGVAVIAVQKKKGTRLPRAGDLIMEKPRLAVTLSSADGQTGSNLGIAEIIKAKLCRGGNHNGKRLRFETVDDGSRFKVIEGWGFLRI